MFISFLFVGVCLLAHSAVSALICDDVDTQACQLIFNKKPDMCNDTSLANNTCPRFCKECPLECYHCDQAVMNFTECNTTRVCNKGEVCMLKELRSSTDGHQEFLMNCETKRHCDGADISFPFGKRDISQRNVNAKCCDTDLCNYPGNQMPTPRTTVQSASPPTSTHRYTGFCYDIDRDCSRYSPYMCTSYPEWARQNCAASCNLCHYPRP